MAVNRTKTPVKPITGVFQCGQQDLNLHIGDTRTQIWRVCQFRHARGYEFFIQRLLTPYVNIQILKDPYA